MPITWRPSNDVKLDRSWSMVSSSSLVYPPSKLSAVYQKKIITIAHNKGRGNDYSNKLIPNKITYFYEYPPMAYYHLRSRNLVLSSHGCLCRIH